MHKQADIQTRTHIHSHRSKKVSRSRKKDKLVAGRSKRWYQVTEGQIEKRTTV